MPEVLSITRQRGVAGSYALTATVQYPAWEPGEPAPVDRITFTGSTFGGPIVMATEGFPRGVFVGAAALDRYGRTLDEAWVRRFFSDEH